MKKPSAFIPAHFKPALRWFSANNWTPFQYQIDTWAAFDQGQSGLLNAPTGSGKTYAIWVAAVMESISKKPVKPIKSAGPKILWITPLRALAKDIRQALQHFTDGLNLDWRIELRTGDTPVSQRKQQLSNAPECLVTTPESLHILFSQKDHALFFKNTESIIVDEWHELLGTKRGVQTELAIAHITAVSKNEIKVWGISATIGNLNEALQVLIPWKKDEDKVIIRANSVKETTIVTILPDSIERFPWSGHLGLNLLPKILPIIRGSNTTLLFTNTRSQTEMWYREILNKMPELAGVMAMHHGSIDQHIRIWVEDALAAGKLKLVVCTSSLDLGVDFSPVDTIIQIGGPKGISRFLQRAGRSGHQPGAASRIFFVPTHSLELIEGSALKTAEKLGIHEDRQPIVAPLDVLVQYLVTLASGAGFDPEKTWKELKSTHAYKNLQNNEWQWALDFITSGGKSLSNYTEYSKVHFESGLFKVASRRLVTRHRLSIGTIVGDPVLQVRLSTGGYLGTIEESFISSLNIGQVFWFGGRPLELVKVKDMVVYGKLSKKKTGKIPAWGGGRLPLSSKLSELIRQKLEAARNDQYDDIEMQTVKPLLEIQQLWSAIPGTDTLLIEKTTTDDGCHVFIFPFEGRFVHEILSALVAFRIGLILPSTFSIAMNDYGFELLSDQDIPIEGALEEDLFTKKNLVEDISECINKSGLAKAKFRDVATIAGLLFRGYPGKLIAQKHLQSSSSLLFDVFSQYDPQNLLLNQAREEVITLQLDYQRLLNALDRINNQKIIMKYPDKFSPFAFPIMADGLRQKLSTEKISDRIIRMQQQLEKYAG